MRVATVLTAMVLCAALCAQEFQAKPEKLEEIVVKFRSGKVHQRYHKKNGKMQGTFEEYWDLPREQVEILKIKGQFLDGKKTGTWTTWPMWNVPKKMREYEYADDKLNGKFTSYGDDGKLEWTGSFKSDKEHGEWTHYNVLGEVIELGQYVEGFREGSWRAEIIDAPLAGASFFEGRFEKGKKQGPWKGLGFDGKIITILASYVDDKPDGKWQCLFADGKVRMEVNFAKGIKHGYSCEYHERGGKKKIEVSYAQGVYEGLLERWYEDGKPEETATWRAGKQVGVSTRYWPSGQKQWERNFDKGSESTWDNEGKKLTEDTGGPDGTALRFYPNGNKQFERKRKKGVVVTEIEYHENGQKKAEGPTHEKDRSKRDGKWKFWYDTGEKEAEGEMCLYGKIGKWVEHHKNGKKKSEGQWFSAFDKLENKVIEIQILKWTWWDEEGKETKTENFPDPRKEKLPGK